MMVRKYSSVLLAVVLLVAGIVASKAAGDSAPGPLAIAKQGFFYVGGRTVSGLTVDEMFVQYQIPAKVTAPYPIVMIHGNFQNGSNFLGTPDDRQGWAEYFVRRGFTVYVMDQAARGRSTYHPGADGTLAYPNAETTERQFTAIEKYNIWPQAKLHTQWPGKGVRGDPVFEQFFASQNPSMTDNLMMDAANRLGGAGLLRKIGPAIVLTHSRSGPFGWEIADDVPELTKAVIAVEPAGPPFYNVVPTATSDPAAARRYGVAFDRLTYDPPVKGIADLAPKREEKPQGQDLQACWLASAPHKLPRLTGIPIMIVTAEASYHAAYDHCTSEYLKQAGVANDFVPLAANGIHGNGHMMMLEKNNLEIARLIADWIGKHVKKS
jgi:pimeloyl-ACP methyl ester carboxylesterase